MNRTRILFFSREGLSRYQELLYGNLEKDLQALRKRLDRPIRFLPKVRRSQVLEARTKLGALLPPDSTQDALPRGICPLPPYHGLDFADSGVRGSIDTYIYRVSPSHPTGDRPQPRRLAARVPALSGSLRELLDQRAS